ncbi:hypothetical protein C7S20_08900 [Christiangramia fulva]|uniref:Uncharacterized protein n=1 Tax=Christiangramia fulva TaxID=2126553 RepID=A0A2R3ZAS0_9FLAO|nr:hypothetical protein C7S20_08900 [Christiangramia fulva]
MLLAPLLMLSQDNAEYMVFENALLTPNPTQIAQFEKGIAAHNKKYHSEGPYGVRMYWISNGPNTGSYVWTMGPFPWSSLDNRPAQAAGHDTDWNLNVAAYMTPESGKQSYWRFHNELSRFPKDFTIKNMLVDYYDIKRGKAKDAMKLIEKINKAYAEKSPNETYGIYTNEFGSSKEGRDLAVISFFDKSAWLGEDNSISKKYDDMYGAGSWDQFLKDWYDLTDGGESEVWIFHPELSGISGNVKVAERQ